MYRRLLSVTLMLCALFYSSVSSAEEKIFANDPIVITALRDEGSVSKEGKSITVITEDDIKNSGKKSLGDVLETVPGIILNRSGVDGGVTNLYIRGSKSGNVLILIDGVKINDPLGIGKLYDISAIRTENIERIEVVRGAMSSLYGAEASGGVINIITRKGTGKKIVITGEAGSDKTFAESISASDATEKSSFNFTASHSKTEGISKAKKINSTGDFDRDGYENITASGKMKSDITDKASLSLTMNYTDSKLDTDDGSDSDDPNHIYNARLFTSRGEFNHKLFQWWNYKAGVSYMSYERQDIDTPDAVDTLENDVYTYSGSNASFDLINKFIIPDLNTLLIGAELVQEKGRSSSAYYNAYAVPAGDEISIFDEQSVITKSLFLHDSFSLFNRLFLNAGGRIDDHELFGSHETWDASASFIIPFSETRLKTSVGTGFRAPSLYELYDPSYGNRDLKPEKSFIYDAGIYQEIFNGGFSFDVTAFRQQYTNMIDFVATKYNNVDGKIRNNGVEVTAGLKPADFISAQYCYTYLKYDRSNEQAVLKRPRHKHYASLVLMPLNGLTINVTYLYVSERDDAFYNELTWTTENVRLDPYHKVDMNIRYAINETFTLTLRGENLTDEDYMETYGYNTRERSFYGGLEIVL